MAIIQTEEDEFVLVSRKDNDKDYGLIGGKVEIGETNYEAMLREVKEETDIDVTSAFVLDERMHDGYYTVCYYVTSFETHKGHGIKEHIELFNDRRQDEGLVSLGSSAKLCDESMTYHEYNVIIIDKVIEYLNEQPVYNAFHSENLYDFMDSLFPYNWGGVKARIIETGVKLSKVPQPWLIGVSDINLTVKSGNTYIQTLVRSCLFTAHDCFHNLWGLPFIDNFSKNSLNIFKKAQMSGEVAVLCVTEFILAKQLQKKHPELTYIIGQRNAVPMISNGEVLYQLSPRDLAGRLDEILHAKMNQLWVRESKTASAFFDDYVPMLQRDRDNIDENWDIMKRENFIPNGLPNVRYSKNMSGSQLTQWMIDDFMHLRSSDEHIDYDLAEFNHKRRAAMKVPSDWVY